MPETLVLWLNYFLDPAFLYDESKNNLRALKKSKCGVNWFIGNSIHSKCCFFSHCQSATRIKCVNQHNTVCPTHALSAAHFKPKRLSSLPFAKVKVSPQIERRTNKGCHQSRIFICSGRKRNSFSNNYFFETKPFWHLRVFLFSPFFLFSSVFFSFFTIWKILHTTKVSEQQHLPYESMVDPAS